MTSTPTNAELHIRPLFATRWRSAITAGLVAVIAVTAWWDLITPGTEAHVVLPAAGFITWALSVQLAAYRKRGMRWPA